MKAWYLGVWLRGGGYIAFGMASRELALAAVARWVARGWDDYAVQEYHGHDGRIIAAHFMDDVIAVKAYEEADESEAVRLQREAIRLMKKETGTDESWRQDEGDE